MANKGENIRQDLENILKSVAESKAIISYEVFCDIKQERMERFSSLFFTGEILDKDNGKTIQVAIKKAPSDWLSNNMVNVIYRNEINFYCRVMPELNKFQRKKGAKQPFDNIPRYFSGNIDAKNMFVAMQNLKFLGYQLLDKKKYFDSEHLEFIFKTYGKFHSLSFTFKQESPEEYEDLVNNFSNVWEPSIDSGGIIVLIAMAYFSALASFDPISEADIVARLRKVENIEEALKNVLSYKGNYRCLTHGDCWSNNMLFKYKDSGEIEDIKLIDFQVPYSSTPVHDLSYFFYSAASKKDMDKLDYYLNYYYQSFSNFARELGGNSDEVFPINVLKKEWKQYALLGVFLGLLVWVVKLMDTNELERILNQNDSPVEKYWDLWADKMIEICNGAEFRERARNICLHAVEYGIL